LRGAAARGSYQERVEVAQAKTKLVAVAFWVRLALPLELQQVVETHAARSATKRARREN